jgi:hypothetical protein
MADRDYACPACEMDVDPLTEDTIPVRQYAIERGLGTTLNVEVHGEHREYVHARCPIPPGWRRDT